MNNFDWQSWTALAVVAVTVVLFAARWYRRKKSGCGAGCGCSGSAMKKVSGKQ